MFGYIRPVRGELLVKEDEFYKSVYCGLCREGGRKISRFTRFFLNYDFVFLCVLHMAVNGEKINAAVLRCPYNLKKRCMVTGGESVTYTAAAFGILLYYKVLDDSRDQKGVRRLFFKLFLRLAAKMKRRAEILYPDLEKGVRISLEKLRGLEKSGCASPDLAADCFAKVTKIVASGGARGEKKEILEECGYHIGRYIYLIDAFEDSRKDAENGEYNVFNNYYSTPEKVLSQSERIKLTLDDSMKAFCRAYEKARSGDYDRLIYNTVQLGSEHAFAQSMEKLKTHGEKRRRGRACKR